MRLRRRPAYGRHCRPAPCVPRSARVPARRTARGAEDFEQAVPGLRPAATPCCATRTAAGVGLDPAPIATRSTRSGPRRAPRGGHPHVRRCRRRHGPRRRRRRARRQRLRAALRRRRRTELPRDQWVPMRDDTIFDLASVSKLFTSIAVVQQMERGRIDLDSPVAAYLPEFAANGKEAVTVRQLLTHTSGLRGLAAAVEQSTRPGRHGSRRCSTQRRPTRRARTYLYCDLNLITLGVLRGAADRRAAGPVVADRITGPLGMTRHRLQPRPRLEPRIAATEYQTAPARGMVWGEVHDENAWSLGGVAGHAGVFSTARRPGGPLPGAAQRRDLRRAPHPAARPASSR